ncbi:hypothetical protein [Legionella gresilensis]|uniref:hypothetical protein n=1 Tax=Legionella gresilensis TaxID=91823 RepID=UPI0010410C98|nr:hypothetical protein [Legionella gresilensis]
MKKNEEGYISQGLQLDNVLNFHSIFSQKSSQNSPSSMASSVDRLKDFANTNQNLWLELSRDTMKELINLLDTFPNPNLNLRADIRCPEEVLSTKLGCAYAFLANKRREIAKTLKHKPLCYQFGLFNKAGFASTDDFNLNKHIPSQCNKIYALLLDLVHTKHPLVEVSKLNKTLTADYSVGAEKSTEDESNPGEEEKATSVGVENAENYTIRIKRSAEELKQIHLMSIASSRPFIEDDTALTITFHNYGKDDLRTSIIIDHNPTPFAENYASESSFFKVQFQLLEPYFEACLNWNSKQKVEDFLINAGRISYSLARLQPVGRGNSAIVEWLIRSLAQAKNIELGAFNSAEGIAWDFKAFLTVDMENYAQWFATSAFTTVSIKDVLAETFEGKENRTFAL